MNVSKHRNHLLKAPFCVHPKTGRVCVPINPAEAEDFDPTTVPTVERLMEEGLRHGKAAAGGAKAGGAGGASAVGGDAAGDAAARFLDQPLAEHTAMKPYIKFFDDFIRGVERELLAARRDDDAAGMAPVLGSW